MAKEKLHLRALIGLWEGEEVIVAGVSHAYEVMEPEEWDRLIERWKETAPHGTDDWQEAWIDMEVDPDAFRPPTLTASVRPTTEDDPS